MQDRRVQWVLGIVTAIILMCGTAGLVAAHRPIPPPIVITQPTAPAAQSAIAPAAVPAPAAPPAAAPPLTKYYVHVAGAVRKPSLYLLTPGSRVMNAIKAAGGATAKADLDAINLAEKVKDGEKVYVPAKTAVPTTMLAPPGNEIGHESVDPGLSAAPTSSLAPKSAKNAKSAKATSSSKADKLTSPVQGQVNINTATSEQLQRLPGIGPAMAARILAYRQQAGGFQKIEELQEISGIGPKKYAKIAPLVKLQ